MPAGSAGLGPDHPAGHDSLGVLAEDPLAGLEEVADAAVDELVHDVPALSTRLDEPAEAQARPGADPVAGTVIHL